MSLPEKSEKKKASSPSKKAEVPFILRDSKESWMKSQEVVRRSDNKVLGEVGTLRFAPRPSHPFRIETVAGPFEKAGTQLGYFRTAEDAAWCLYISYNAADQFRQQCPVPDLVLESLNSRARNLHDKAEVARKLCFEVWAEMRDLKYMVEKLGIKNGFDNVYIKRTPEIKDLTEWKRSGDEHPFFSEAILYELLGKDDARSLLGRVQNVVAMIDPVMANEV